MCCVSDVWTMNTSCEQALMTAEMSSLISDNGGFVVLGQVAFGDFWSWLCGVNGCVANLFDLALYPAFIAEYATEYADFTSTEVCLWPCGRHVPCHQQFSLHVFVCNTADLPHQVCRSVGVLLDESSGN
jgi:amino acid transporter